MDCADASTAVRVQASSCSSENGVTTLSTSPIVVVLLLHGDSENIDTVGKSSSNSSSSSSSRTSALLKSLKSVGPEIMLPHGSRPNFPLTIRCIASTPPVCVVHAHVNSAVGAAASVLPDLVILLPCCSDLQSLKSTEFLLQNIRNSLPTFPVFSALDPPAAAAALCSVLTDGSSFQWPRFAEASAICATSIW